MDADTEAESNEYFTMLNKTAIVASLNSRFNKTALLAKKNGSAWTVKG